MEKQAIERNAGPAKTLTRKNWRKPGFRVLGLESTQTGTGSAGTDGASTHSSS